MQVAVGEAIAPAPIRSHLDASSARIACDIYPPLQVWYPLLIWSCQPQSKEEATNDSIRFETMEVWSTG